MAESLAPPPALDAVLLSVALVSVSFSGPLMAATAAPALAIAFWRNAFGGGVAGALAVARRLGELRALERRTVLAAVLAGVALSAHFGLWVPSLGLTSVASATALVCCQTIFTPMLAHVLGRRVPGRAWLGIVAATVGAGLVTGADVTVSGRAALGDLLALGGGVAGAVYVTVGASARIRASATTYTALCYGTCALVLLAVCLVFGVRLGGYPGDAWLKLVLVTLSAQLLGHSLINVVLRSTSPTVVSLAILFEVPGAGLVAYLWLHQRPSLIALPGIATLLAGMALVARARPRPTPVPD